MRIAVIGPIFSDSFAKCIVHTLFDMGHDVLSVNPEKSFLSGYLSESFYHRNFLKIKSIEIGLTKTVPSLEKYQWITVKREINKFEPEIIISVIWEISPDILEELKKSTRSAPITTLWCADSLANFGRQFIFAAPWDYLFFKDRHIVSFCKEKLALNAHLLPLGCYPKWHQKVNLSWEEKRTYSCDITIAGGLYYYRAKFFENLVQYHIKIWGPPPPNYVKSPVRKFYQNKYVGEIEKSKAFNGAAIVLNNMHYSEIMGLNQRVFDACGCGAFQIVDANPVMEEYFIPGKELVCFHDLQELQELIPYYLNRPQERKEIAHAGYTRAHTEHTFQHRLETMLQIITGSP